MFLFKRSVGLFLIIMMLTICLSGQVLNKESSDQLAFDKIEAEKWVADYTQSLYREMNPRETLLKSIYYGKLTKDESKKTFRKWVNNPKKIVPKGYLKRYLNLALERDFYELFLSLGAKEFSADFSEIEYDDDGFTLIKNKDYANLLLETLKKNRISKESYINFFQKDGKPVTSKQIIRIEAALIDVLKLVKSKINFQIYDKNVKLFGKLWKIECSKDNKYCSVVNGLGGTFIIGKKNGRFQILDFSGEID